MIEESRGLLTPAAAQTLAAEAFAWLADQPEALGRFLSLTGLGPANIRQAARQPGFLAGVLDYVASDEPLLLAFAQNAGIRPDRVVAARRALDGAAGDP